MRKNKLLALALTAVMTATALAGCSGKDDSSETTNGSNNNPSAEATDNAYGLRDKTEDGTILHCFSWSFETITESLEDIAMAGYSTIQTSPINACYDGGDAGMELFGQGKWYYHYQPTDWTIGNYQLGTSEEFTKMCEVAHSYGIKVLVDVAPNHTTKATEAINENLLNAVGGIDNLYHSDGYTAISDYSDRSQCTLNAVGGLYDVNTENPDFQDYFISYLNECIACGADGFRYDTAKHIGLDGDPQDDPNLPNNFWDRVTTEVTNANSLFMYGECLQDGSERLADYIEAIGATTASSYGSIIRNSFSSTLLYANSITDLKIDDASPNVVTWVESHDNYTGDETTYNSITNEKIVLAWTLLAARDVGTPLFFARPYGATASNMWGNFNKIGMVGDNLYKDPTVVAANRFRNAMTGLTEKLYNPEDSNKSVLAIERGTKGLVIINAGSNKFEGTFETSLENGEYTDRVSGTKYTVSDGKITTTCDGKTAVVLYNEGYVDLATPAVVKVADDTQGNFIGDSLDVTLESTNSVKSTYSINGGAQTEFSNGDVITIGNDLKPSEILRLTLSGENEAGNKTNISYIFKKQDTIMSGTKIYFEKPANWADTIYCYVYDETTYSYVKESAAWPGTEMTVESDGTYSYTFNQDWVAPLVIFADKTNQSNGTLEPGAAVIADKVYSLN